MHCEQMLRIHLHRVEPVELVTVLVRVQRLPVREIGADHAHAVDCRGEHTFLRVHEIGQISDYLFDWQTGQDRHAVVGFLPAECDRKPGRVKFGVRKFIVGEFGFLQAKHVAVCRGEPIEYVWQSHLQGVDIPGGEAHLGTGQTDNCIFEQNFKRLHDTEKSKRPLDASGPYLLMKWLAQSCLQNPLNQPGRSPLGAAGAEGDGDGVAAAGTDAGLAFASSAAGFSGAAATGGGDL